jgi:alpha-galactosidase
MSAFPKFILRKLYLPRSLCSRSDGFEFVVKNNIAPVTVIALNQITADADTYGASSIFVSGQDGRERPATAIQAPAPLQLGKGIEVRVRIVGKPLAVGQKHRLEIRVTTAEVGSVDIPIDDAAGAAAAIPATPAAAADMPAWRQERTEVAGEMPSRGQARTVKIAIIGAGSTVFARQLMTDILAIPALQEGVFALVDIDSERLELAQQIGERLIALSQKQWRIEASTDRTRVLRDCDYAINTIEVAGLANVRHDFDIPLKYGVNQCIGDTIGPGGIFKALRTGPTWLDIVRDIERLSPRAMILNYTNPMSILTLAALKSTRLPVVGLCHSVQGTSRQLADYLDVPYAELYWRCAGINHNAWFTVLEHQGVDQYPRLLERARDPEIYDSDPIRFEMARYFGAFVTESSGHFSEYVPYFRKRPELIERYCRAGYRGETGFYANNWPRWRQANDENIRALLAGRAEISLARSEEYAADIIEAHQFDRPAVIYGNVRNQGLIDNLPDGCVETPVLVDRHGLTATHFGPLPPQLAALNRAHMAVHELVVEALLARNLQAARYALQLDPLTAAVCAPADIDAMFTEMWSAQRSDLSYWDE